MIDTGRPAKTVIAALQKEHVYIGRIWPVWPNAVRISVGSPEDMARFRTAFKKVMDTPPQVASSSGDGDGLAPTRAGRFLS
jgi:histidinol-phosphate aminotransferase